MSRIGKSPVPLPSGVEVKVDGSGVSVTGAKGTLERTFDPRMSFTVSDGSVEVARANDERETRALHGLSRALLNNMVVGVSEGYRKDLEMVGVGYRVSLKGNVIELLVGFSHSVQITAPDGIQFEVPENTKISVIGIDKQLVGQIAADIRKVRPPEPYKGKGIRYAGEHVRRKAGKAGVTA
jgi:large subunit ribosomal protein L6